MRLLFWLAVLPSALLAWQVIRYDRIEREPAGLLMKLFVLGALTCLPAAIIEGVGDSALQQMMLQAAMSHLTYSALTYLVVVPLAEEAMKYLALRTTRNNRHFDYTFDGIVYGVMVGLGFATLENLIYVFEYQSLEVALMRGVLAVPLHCTCGVFMGFYYGAARNLEAHGDGARAALARAQALVVPCVIHGLYDFSLDIDNGLVTLAGFAFTIAVFLMASRRVRVASAHDTPIYAEPLTAPVSRKVPRQPASRHSASRRGTPPPPMGR